MIEKIETTKFCSIPGEDHHWVCGCGDCACHGWDGAHQGVQHSCDCHPEEFKKRHGYERIYD